MIAGKRRIKKRMLKILDLFIDATYPVYLLYTFVPDLVAKREHLVSDAYKIMPSAHKGTTKF
jgi:hypothetical protein